MYIVCHAWYGHASEPRGAWAQCIGAAHRGAVRCVAAAVPRARLLLARACLLPVAAGSLPTRWPLCHYMCCACVVHVLCMCCAVLSCAMLCMCMCCVVHVHVLCMCCACAVHACAVISCVCAVLCRACVVLCMPCSCACAMHVLHVFPVHVHVLCMCCT